MPPPRHELVPEERPDVLRVRPQGALFKGCSGNLEFFGRLTLGDTLSLQLSVLLKEVRTFESIPAWLTTMVDLWHVLDDGSHHRSQLKL
jgi:hypothetical protein